jgi:uncharacterized Zn finger protein
MLKSTNWIAEDLCEFISQVFSSEIHEEVRQLIHEKRVHEVYIEPGRVSSRIVADNKRSKRVVITLNEFTPEVWETVIAMIAANPLLSAQCYNQHLPVSVKAFFAIHNVSLTGSEDEFACIVDDQPVPFQSVEAAAVLEKFAEQLIANPFGFCTFRGKNVEQIIHEIREKRSAIASVEDFLLRPDSEVSLRKESVQEFYEGDLKGIPDILVRADELPASILKRLDPIPLETPEIEVDSHLEAAYGRVARLSQSLARFLPQVRREE